MRGGGVWSGQQSPREVSPWAHRRDFSQEHRRELEPLLEPPTGLSAPPTTAHPGGSLCEGGRASGWAPRQPVQPRLPPEGSCWVRALPADRRCVPTGGRSSSNSEGFYQRATRRTRCWRSVGQRAGRGLQPMCGAGRSFCAGQIELGVREGCRAQLCRARGQGRGPGAGCGGAQGDRPVCQRGRLRCCERFPCAHGLEREARDVPRRGPPRVGPGSRTGKPSSCDTKAAALTGRGRVFPGVVRLPWDRGPARGRLSTPSESGPGRTPLSGRFLLGGERRQEINAPVIGAHPHGRAGAGC